MTSTPLPRSRWLVAYRRIVIVMMAITAALYSVFVVYPAYSSGIYRLSTTQIERFSIDIPMLEYTGLALLTGLIVFVTMFITVS
jgi:hypothetical protein